jgi:hypothetical protein
LLLFFLGIDSKLQKLPRSETTKSKSSSSLKEDKKVYFSLFEAEWTNKVECLKLQKMRHIQLGIVILGVLTFSYYKRLFCL